MQRLLQQVFDIVMKLDPADSTASLRQLSTMVTGAQGATDSIENTYLDVLEPLDLAEL